MRTVSIIAGVLVCISISGTSFGWTGEKSEEVKSDVEHVVVNRPVLEEKLERAPEDVPLHEHPTLLKMLQRNNELRQRVGLRPHRMNPALTKAAQNHANYMARTGDFNHYSNNGPSGRAQRNGFRGGVQENIAMGTSTVDSVFSVWQHSGAHWANMTSHTTDAGFGFQQSANGTCYWVAVYGNGSGETTVVSGRVE